MHDRQKEKFPEYFEILFLYFIRFKTKTKCLHDFNSQLRNYILQLEVETHRWHYSPVVLSKTYRVYRTRIYSYQKVMNYYIVQLPWQMFQINHKWAERAKPWKIVQYPRIEKQIDISDMYFHEMGYFLHTYVGRYVL